MRPQLLAILLAITGGALVGASFPEAPVRAGTAVRLSLEERLAHCDLALEVSVVSARCLLGPGGRPETQYLLDVHRTLWGDDLPTREVRLPGGVLPDGSGMLVPGLPILQPGERAVLFLTEPGRTGARMPVGLGQGRLSIQAGPGGSKWAVCDPADHALLDARSNSLVPSIASAIPYADVLATLEAAAVARGAREERGR
jgi:hypothetical protein